MSKLSEWILEDIARRQQSGRWDAFKNHTVFTEPAECPRCFNASPSVRDSPCRYDCECHACGHTWAENKGKH